MSKLTPKQGRSLPEWLSLCALTVQQSINWITVLVAFLLGLLCGLGWVDSAPWRRWQW